MKFKEKLEIRFYGHDKAGLDASWIKYLPNVSHLSVDCMRNIINENQIAKLENLSIFSFGVDAFEDNEFLLKINPYKLKSLEIGETYKKNINLSYITKFKKLEELYVVGYLKGIENIATLPVLEKLTLSNWQETIDRFS